jgi:hypothetical protein
LKISLTVKGVNAYFTRKKRMPSKYVTRREQIINFIKEVIIPAVEKQKTGNYDKAVNVIIVHKSVSKNMAQECLDAVIDAGLLKKKKAGELIKGREGAISL